jgi:hypothetical protein
MTTRTHNTLYEQERIWFFTAISCVVVSVLCYMYFLSTSVVHVVMRKEIDKEMASLSSSVGSLEAEYIEVQHAVSEDIASLKGYKRTDTKVFIDRTEGTLSLSSN